MRRCAIGEFQLLHRQENTAASQAQSVAGSLPWGSQMCPRLLPFLSGLYAFFGNRKGFAKNWRKIADYELKMWGLFIEVVAFPPIGRFFLGGGALKIEIYTGACARSPFGEREVYKLGIWNLNWGF